MLVVTGSFIAKAAHLNEARALSLEHTQRTRSEDGCLLFSLNIDAENANRMVFIECWRDMSALRVHLKLLECKRFAAQIELLAESIEPLTMYEAQQLVI
jgi:quinol monooxygenase YgiN